MARRKRWIIVFLLVLFGLALVGVGWRYFRDRHSVPGGYMENTGEFAGPLTRSPVAYNPSIAPSRLWLDTQRAATPHTTFHEYAAASINGHKTYYLLYLPPDYHDPGSASRRYPVIYWLHGWSAGPTEGVAFVETLHAAILAGHAPPVIAVLPHGLYDSWYVDSVDGSQPVESVIIMDLLPLIDKTWRTIPDRRARAVEGFSMGGWGAGHLAFKYPEFFCAATMVSPPLHTHYSFPQFGRIFSGDAAAYYAEDPVTRVRRDGARLGEMVRLRLLVGGNDFTQPFARAFAARLTEWKFPHELIVVPGAGHSDADIYERLGPGVFAFYKSLFPATPG